MTEATGMNHWIDPNGIVRIVFGRPEDKVNVLSPDILQELGDLLDSVRGREDVRGLIFSSATPGNFIAGMDVEVIASFTDAFKAAEGARFGQIVFQKIEDLPVPSACAINGACLGGGTELALACTVRVAADSRAVKIGLPETQLGIIPGFGGTQRLPRLVGPAKALEMNTTGDPIGAEEAYEHGLVNRVVADHELFDTALAWARKFARQPPLALEQIKQVSHRGDLDEGIAAEKQAFAAVLASRDAREGIDAFLGKRTPRFKGA